MTLTPLSRRKLLAGAAATLASTLPLPLHAQARGDGYRILCGYPPGGPADLIGRKLAERLAERTGLPAVVENKVGGAGRVAVAELLKGDANGLTVLITPASVLTMYPHLYRQLGYDAFADLAPLGTLAATSFALAAGPAVPDTVQNLNDLVRWGRTQAAVACGNSGAGSMQHFLALLLARESGLPITHVPYRGGAPSMQAVAGGEVALAIGTESAARALTQAGRTRVLATTGAQRSPLYPQASTFAEHGWPALRMREWFGAFVAGRTATAAVERAAAHVRAMAEDPAIRETWERQSLLADQLSAAELREAIRREHGFWGPVIRESGFTADA